jgi:hypothetical protein
LRPRPGHAGLHALADESTLELSEVRHHAEHELTLRRDLQR